MIRKLSQSVVEYDEEAAKKAAEEILRAGIDPLMAIEEGISPAARIVGEKFEKGEYFLPHLLLAAEAVKVASDILTAGLRMKDRLEMEAKGLGDVVIATVSGDIHDIGKNIVALLLSVNGFKIHDLGRDVESMAIVQRAIDVKADIIALSALMSTTLPSQREV
ncbi:MAG: B12-binding domain-containing protein, partial [Candidatus Bathyarchaeia archaeon]